MTLCALCAGLGSTCCQQTDVLLTARDIRRIETHTARWGFFEYRKPQDPTCVGAEDDPNWLLYTLRPDGMRRVLRHAPGGGCLFLTSSGCTLPVEARPLICRLHPLTYNESGITGTCPDCPSALLDGDRDLLEAVGMSRDEGEQWRAQLYAELREELASHARLLPLPASGFVSPPVAPDHVGNAPLLSGRRSRAAAAS